MANPKRKHTRSRRDMRRASNWKLTPPNITTCPQCGNTRFPHSICPACGFYKGQVVMTIKKKDKNKPEGPKG